MKKEINLWSLPPNIRVNLNKDYLKSLMIKASNNEKPHCDENFIKKLGLIKTSKYSSITIYGWLNYNSTLPLEKLKIITNLANCSERDIQKHIKSIKYGPKGGEISPKLPIKIGKEFGSIIGHILGDGAIDKKYQQVFFSNSNKELLHEFHSYMDDIFKIKPRIWMQTESDFNGKTRWERRLKDIEELKLKRNCGLFYPSTCGIILNYYFENFAVGKIKEVSNSILSSNKEFKRGFIRAFYDDEATVGSKNIRLFQDNKNTLEKFRALLKEFKIYPNTIKTYIKRDKERYYFDIHRKSNLNKFKEEIGFTSSKKAKKLDNICIIKRKDLAK